MEQTPEVTLSAIQHWLYCPRQCGLIHVERCWSENRATAKGRVRHESVHHEHGISRPGVRREHGLRLCCQRLGMAGVADVVEFHADGRVVPVEVKVGKPKHGPNGVTPAPEERLDLAQLCAQAMCLEEMLGLSIPEGAIWYEAVRRRISVAFDASLRELVERSVSEIRQMFAQARLPQARFASRLCRGCSLLAHCLPKLPGERATLAALSALTKPDAPLGDEELSDGEL